MQSKVHEPPAGGFRGAKAKKDGEGLKATYSTVQALYIDARLGRRIKCTLALPHLHAPRM